MGKELNWIMQLEGIRKRLLQGDKLDWMKEWRVFHEILQEAVEEHPEIKLLSPGAIETFGEDVIPSARVQELVEQTIRQLLPCTKNTIYRGYEIRPSFESGQWTATFWKQGEAQSSAKSVSADTLDDVVSLARVAIEGQLGPSQPPTSA